MTVFLKRDAMMSLLLLLLEQFIIYSTEIISLIKYSIVLVIIIIAICIICKIPDS